MKKMIIVFMLLLTITTLAFTGCMLKSDDKSSKYEKEEDTEEEDTEEDTEEDATNVDNENDEDVQEDEATDDDKKNDDEDVSLATVEPYGFTAYFDPQKEPEGTVDFYSPTDTIYYVVIAGNFPAGSSIHQVWEYLEDGSTLEGDLSIPMDIEYNYLGFNLSPDGELPVGRYQVTLTWTVNGVDGELVSDIIEVK